MNINGTIKLNEDTKNIRFYQNMIILVMLFAPFTSLRFLRIGVTESMSLVLFLFVLISWYKIKLKDKNIFIFTKFWLIYFLISGIGLFHNYVLMSSTSGTINGMLFDTMSYIVVAITCFSLEMIIYNKKEIRIDYILHRIFIYSSSSLMLLFLLSRVTGSIFGLSLLDGAGNFRPLADNIHHVAMFVGPLPFIGLHYLRIIKHNISKVLHIVLIISNIIIILNVGSDKAKLGLYIGFTSILIFLFFEKINKYEKKYLYILAVLLLTAIFIINYEYLLNKFLFYFAEADGGGARQLLYTSAVYQSFESPFFGYGPGQHIPFYGVGFADTHSTFLTVLLQSGVIGLISFIVLLGKLFNKIKMNKYFMAAFLTVFIYIAGGDILRRLPIWIYLILFYYKLLMDYYKKTSLL